MIMTEPAEPKSSQPSLPKEFSKEHCFPSYNVCRLVLVAFRLVIIAAIMFFVIIFQEYIRPRIMIPSIRRYLSCIVNLICLRSILLVLGFFRFQCQNYRYFDKASRMLTFRSGWVGVTPRQSIIEFFYFSYLFNPTYVRMVQYHQNNPKTNSTNVKLFYTPLTFKQAFFASLDQQGFDPIVLNGDLELKKFKRRKMLMPTLISECFEELNGPVLIFLPSFKLKEQPKMHQILGKDIYENQRRWVRSGVVFISEVEQFEGRAKRKVADYCLKPHNSQLMLLTDVCSQFKQNILAVTATQTLKFKFEYNEQTYCQFVDEIFARSDYKIHNISFSQYKKQVKQSEDGANFSQYAENSEELLLEQKQQESSIMVKMEDHDYFEGRNELSEINKTLHQVKQQ